ncbi:regulator of G-protein signaling 14 isoform X2 [Ahaetulla prasina]|uniref:regulator of G-protein signaling 14 isoform X2 n=1 Tax=Ahaetulla prasina TaxID=499056 RepID=UPI0026486A57|nr:regulator of G-protein signaling 14 isoform X2 [Ahaetulla prasina]
MLGKPKHLGVQNGRMGLAVSDGELNSSGSRGSNNSVNSLPCTQSLPPSLGQSVARWAESFETLLQDQLGVAYFTEFLKKEFSAENVYFWQACEQFQQIPASSTQKLAQEARKIYDEFLSSHSVNPVNIDRQAWIGEEMLSTPTPEMFHVQQLQIFNLMKFDSYARFVKSALYQACAKAESQGQPLPELRSSSQTGSPPTEHSKKTKLKAGKSLPLGVEAAGNLAGRSPRRSFRKGDRRDRPWGEERNGGEGPSPWRDSQGSLNSSASLDLGFLSYATSGLQAEKPLALNQDSLVLMDQEVKLETRVNFELHITPINKTVRILAKSTKTLQEALQPILEKYSLDIRQVSLKRSGGLQTLKLEEKVSAVAAQKLVLDSDAEVKPVMVADATCEQFEDDNTLETESESDPLLAMSCPFTKSIKSNQNRHTYDMEGLMELLTRAQNCRVNDQRGLLSKEDLILPDFLQVPKQGGVTCTSHSSSSPENCTLEAPKDDTSQHQSQVQSQPQVSPSSPLQIPTSSSTSAAGKSDL